MKKLFFKIGFLILSMQISASLMSMEKQSYAWFKTKNGDILRFGENKMRYAETLFDLHTASEPKSTKEDPIIIREVTTNSLQIIKRMVKQLVHMKNLALEKQIEKLIEYLNTCPYRISPDLLKASRFLDFTIGKLALETMGFYDDQEEAEMVFAGDLEKLVEHTMQKQKRKIAVLETEDKRSFAISGRFAKRARILENSGQDSEKADQLETIACPISSETFTLFKEIVQRLDQFEAAAQDLSSEAQHAYFVKRIYELLKNKNCSLDDLIELAKAGDFFDAPVILQVAITLISEYIVKFPKYYDFESLNLTGPIAFLIAEELKKHLSQQFLTQSMDIEQQKKGCIAELFEDFLVMTDSYKKDAAFIYDIKNKKRIDLESIVVLGEVTNFKYNSHKKQLAAYNKFIDGIVIWDVCTGKIIYSISFKGKRFNSWKLEFDFTHDGNALRILVNEWVGYVFYELNLNNGESNRVYEVSNNDYPHIINATLLPSGKGFIFFENPNARDTILHYINERGHEVKITISSHKLLWCYDSVRSQVVTYNQIAREMVIWDLISGAKVTTIKKHGKGTAGIVYDIAVAPNGTIALLMLDGDIDSESKKISVLDGARICLFNRLLTTHKMFACLNISQTFDVFFKKFYFADSKNIIVDGDSKIQIWNIRGIQRYSNSYRYHNSSRKFFSLPNGFLKIVQTDYGQDSDSFCINTINYLYDTNAIRKKFKGLSFSEVVLVNYILASENIVLYEAQQELYKNLPAIIKTILDHRIQNNN